MTTLTTTQLKTRLTTALTTLKTLSQADWAPALERSARALAIAIAFTYAAGWLLGTWVHQSSRLLARFAAELAEPDWHQQRLAQLKARLEAQAIKPVAQELQPVVRTKRSKLPQPAPKPSRQRRPRNAKRTTAPALA